jgi:hypothetical protein
MAVSMTTTSVPRWATAWPQRDGDVESSASCYLVVAVGAAARIPAHALVRRPRPLCVMSIALTDPDDVACVGLAQVWARIETGVIDILDGNSGCTQRTRQVFCAHCHTVTLTVYHHFSRRHHAYLGYQADSEDLT